MRLPGQPARASPSSQIHRHRNQAGAMRLATLDATSPTACQVPLPRRSKEKGTGCACQRRVESSSRPPQDPGPRDSERTAHGLTQVLNCHLDHQPVHVVTCSSLHVSSEVEGCRHSPLPRCGLNMLSWTQRVALILILSFLKLLLQCIWSHGLWQAFLPSCLQVPDRSWTEVMLC